jgi:DNA invertase Pin-like site-specific DNA recombinase
MPRLIGCSRLTPDDPRAALQTELLQELGCSPILLLDKPRRHRSILFGAAQAGDIIAAKSLVHFGISLADLQRFLRTAVERGLHLKTIDEDIDTQRSADGKLIRILVATLSSFDAERIKIAMEKARRRGSVVGRRKRFSDEDWPVIAEALETETLSAVAKRLGVGRETIYKLKRRMTGS